jgi:O-antigen/teichoic acid export membrane protein
MAIFDSTKRTTRLRELASIPIIRHNAILFVGSFVSGFGGFVYHAIAGRELGHLYGQVSSLVSAYSILLVIYTLIMTVTARFAASSIEKGSQGMRNLGITVTMFALVPAAALMLFSELLGGDFKNFLHLTSTSPVFFLALSGAMIFLVGVPRGILQGTQRFGALSSNLIIEMIFRTFGVFILIKLGFGVTGTMIAIALGAAVAYLTGIYTCKDNLTENVYSIAARMIAGYTVPVLIGTLGILLMYNMDVILAQHYLPTQSWQYGALNKIATIIYFLTISVSQVLFPKVVAARSRGDRPHRTVFLSFAIMSLMGLAVLLVFWLAPNLLILALYGSSFLVIKNLVFPIGIMGLAVSLSNLLVNYFLSSQDYRFIIALIMSCIMQPVLIGMFHRTVAQIVWSEVSATCFLLFTLCGFYFIHYFEERRQELGKA